MPEGWVPGRINGGPLALRATQDELQVRIIVDGSVIEAYWDGGRAAMTSRSYPPASSMEEAGLKISAVGGGGLAVDVQAWEMGSAWLEPVE